MQTRTEEITTPSGQMGVHVVRPDGEGRSRSSCSSITDPVSTKVEADHGAHR
jgi:hypothetical protein